MRSNRGFLCRLSILLLVGALSLGAFAGAAFAGKGGSGGGGGGGGGKPKPTQSPSPSATPTPTSSPSPTVSPSTTPTPTPTTAPTPQILFNQFADYGTGMGYVSSGYEDDLADDSQAADDFSVPRNRAWQVTKVEARGFFGYELPEYYSGRVFHLLEAATFDLTIYADDSGRPGVTAVASFQDITPAAVDWHDNGQTFTFTLPSAVELTGGTYWLSIQHRTQFGQGRWYWRDVWSGSGSPAMWRGDSGTDTGSCTDWGSACWGWDYEHNFRLTGLSR